MEQRIGSSSQPLDTAAVDPAAIPGLTSPVPTEPADRVPDPVPPAKEAPPAEEEAAQKESAQEEAASKTEAEAETEAETAAPEGPVFEASDRRAKIIADHSGVRLALDDQECEFRWDEIGAVETETSRFGKRFTVTVHTPDRRWYPVEIEATAKSQHQEWETDLDKVLDTYFEDEKEDVKEAEESTP